MSLQTPALLLLDYDVTNTVPQCAYVAPVPSPAHYSTCLYPVTLLQLQGQVDLRKVLKAKATQRLNLSFDFACHHDLQLLDPFGVGFDEILLQLFK